MKRLLTVLFAFSVLLGIGQSKKPISGKQSFDKSRKLLDEVSAKVSSLSNIYIEFKYSFNNPKQEIKRETRGNVTLEKDKYVLNYMDITKIFDGKLVYSIVPENEEVTIEPLENRDDDSITPTELLTFYKKGFKYKWDIVQRVGGKKIQYIELKPTNADSKTKQILLGIDIKNKMIHNIIETGKDEARTTITVTGLKFNNKLSANTFSFDEDKYRKMGYYIMKF